MKIFETHAHYDDEAFREDREALFDEMFANDIDTIINVGASFAGCEQSVALADSHEKIYAAVGIHPEDVEELTEARMAWLKKTASENQKVLAIGEIGLDYHYPEPAKEIQQQWFRRINTAYGYTDARFVRYDNGIEDFKDNRIPYAPQHTLSAQAAWTLPTGVKWLGDVVLQAGVRCAGRIWWNEENTLSQPFYALADASVRFEHKHYSLDIWGRNLGGARYDVFYFKSIGNEFVQRGRPRTFGITLNINI